MTLDLKADVMTLGRKAGLGHNSTMPSPSPKDRQDAWTESAHKSPALLADANANKRAVLKATHSGLASAAGSKGGPDSPLRTTLRSQTGGVLWSGGLLLRAPPQKTFNQRMRAGCEPPESVVTRSNGCREHRQGGDSPPLVKELL
uniref:Uncharacterized protein n=1 Tax=Knipowitschia caucasica TaxID=637954 RepID=A0AAV2LSE5_KNICA